MIRLTAARDQRKEKKLEIYKMTEVETVPDSRLGTHKNGKWVNQLRGFIESNKKQVKIELPLHESRKAYCGLVQACRRPEFNGKVKVTKNNKDVYLICKG